MMPYTVVRASISSTHREKPAWDSDAPLRVGFPNCEDTPGAHHDVLRESGFANVRAEGTRRLYAVVPAPLREVDEWLDRYRRFWTQHLDALGTELARGKRDRRRKR